MWQLIKGLGKVGWSILGIGGAAAATNVVYDPKDGAVVNIATDLMTAAANAGTESGVDTAFQGFYKFFEKLADMIESFTGEGSMMAMRNWARRGMGEDEVSYTNTTLNGGDGETTLAGAAGADTLGITYTAENALTFENFSNFEGALDADNVLHKANVFAHGVAEGAVHVVNLVGHAADGLDYVSGSVLSWVGIDTGYEERNISAAAHRTMMAGVDGVWGAVGTVPELKTAWDRAVHFGGELAPALVTGYAAAPLLSGTFMGMATAPALNATLGTTLGNAFTAAVAGLGLTSTAGIVLNAGGLALIPSLDRG